MTGSTVGSVTESFVDAILESPLGVTLLARIETLARRPEGWSSLVDSSPDGVERALDLLGSMAIGEFMELVVFSAVIDVGPWSPDAPRHAARAYRCATDRAPIAAAIGERFGEVLHRPLDLDAQQWWTTAGSWNHELAPLFVDFENVYGPGQFTWAGLWTVSDPPEVAHAQLVDAWEMHDGPVTRWRLPVRSGARVFEINGPDDWAKLVTEHPREAASHAEHWELPGINQDPSTVQELLDVSGQRAARTRIRSHLVPDWRSVAEHWDGVHLTWAGFVTAEGCITELGGGDVTMLRYWFSERTLWLSDMFTQPEPLAPPRMDDDTLSDGSPAIVHPGDLEARRERDLALLSELLGRPRGF